MVNQKYHSRQKAISSADWFAMPEASRIECLRAGSCLIGQGRERVKPGDFSRWGAGFEFGDSPVHSFAILDETDALIDALRLGAMPFALDLEGDGVFKYGFSRLSSRGGDPKAASAARMLLAAWSAGAHLLDSSSPDWVGQADEEEIRRVIALECFAYGVLLDARALGIPVEASWFLKSESHYALMRADAIQWSAPGQLDNMVACGMDLHSPIDCFSPEPPESLWCWLADDQPDPESAARLLWSSGNDPRVADASGVIPLEKLSSEPESQRIAFYASGFIRTSLELDDLDRETPEPLPRPGRRSSGI